MKPVCLPILAILIACSSSIVATAEPRDTPANEFDLQGFIDAKLASGERRIVIPPGRYRVAPRHGAHLRFQDLADVELIADGVEMICTNTSISWSPTTRSRTGPPGTRSRRANAPASSCGT
jgi:hypothetical protein